MAPENQDSAYLWDIQEAAKEAVEILGEMDVKTFKKDKIRCRAVERALEIIRGSRAPGISEIPDPASRNSMA
jgi:uncharacterized protein with HEPN domain